MEGKYLVTFDNWFMAPDGQTYLAAWGDIVILQDSMLGIKTNSRSTNWYARVGTDSNHIVVAGCQIHYAVKCDKRPVMGPCVLEERHNGENKQYNVMTRIYCFE